jgi:hypothetical protein
MYWIFFKREGREGSEDLPDKIFNTASCSNCELMQTRVVLNSV